MSFDFSTLVTDRTQADVSRVKQIAEKIKNGTASESELAEFNSAAMKGAYNHTDLNRVTAAMEALKAKLEGYGYAVPGYQRIKVPHVLPEPEPTSRLPEGYLELAWIESTGTQYIDTGFKPNNNTRVVMDAELVGTGTVSLFGARNSAVVKNYSILSLSTYIRSDYNTEYSQQFAVNVNTRRVYDKNKETTTIDGTSKSYTNATFQADNTMFLFACNENGTARFQSSARQYSCQIYDNGTRIRDYIPCIDPSGTVGLYDLVTAAFFGNSGTGSFVAGAVPRKLPEGYTQVGYIESSGTQYIDTGFKANQDTRVCVEAESTVVPTTHSVLFGGRTSGLSKSFGFWWYVQSFGSRFDYGVYDADTQIILPVNTKIAVDANKGECSYGEYSESNTYSDFQCDYSLVLFAMNTAGTIANFFKGKIYSCQIYDNGTLIRDFVPCENSNGVFGLYDLANGVFYQNAGSGAFAAGEEIVAPATASVTVVSDDVTEYDPYTWYEFDWPTPETMTVYLLNVAAIRSVLAVLKSTPKAPSDAVGFMVQEANDIEVILLDVYAQLLIMPTTFIPCGEALCGGDNL